MICILGMYPHVEALTKASFRTFTGRGSRDLVSHLPLREHARLVRVYLRSIYKTNDLPSFLETISG
ncbi:uncharacterized protein BDZ83DRAFT_642256 [Colletotrichum acutatum]|uniref:Uncharacterized protein n=1 Tax=Glomerella acutata TaxID=27357 RepID=A0AAD8XB93_GLOAC|nr:uncharacterized protein BDZ83DRAFT_642256 [Colletotrichum acutatum]KAK1708390.1 hypothetical protein BDZ83DRAFT_642256 [Colletotrichum acutatum]